MTEPSFETNVKRRALFAGVAAALSAPMIRGYAAPAEKLVIRTDLAAWGVHAALFYASRKGWYKDAGLDVEIQDGTGSLNTINLVGAGRVDVGFVQLGPMAVARASGIPVRAISGFLRRADLAVLVDKESGPKKPEELAGKKLLCFATSPWALFIDNYLAHYGLRRGTGKNDVNVVMVSPGAMATMYASGQADGFMSILEYALPLANVMRPTIALAATDANIRFPSYGFIVNEQAIAPKAPFLKRLNEIQRRAWQAFVDNPAELNEAIAGIASERPNAQIKKEVLFEQAKLSLDFLNTDHISGRFGWQSDVDWQESMKYMSSIGAIPPSAKASEFYTNDLVG